MDGRDPVALDLQPIDRLPGFEPDPAPDGRGRQGAEVPGVSYLGPVGQEVDQSQLGAQGRLDPRRIAGRQPLVDDPLLAPPAGRGAQLVLLGLRAGHVDPAAAAIAVIDARLLAERGRPRGVQLARSRTAASPSEAATRGRSSLAGGISPAPAHEASRPSSRRSRTVTAMPSRASA